MSIWRGLVRYPAREVGAASRRIVRLLRASAGGSLPTTAAGWAKLAAAFGVDCVPTFAAPPEFCARLICDARERWFIFYNGRASDACQSRYLCHDLAEAVSLMSAEPFDGCLGTAQRLYTGADYPQDVHHRIAQRVESLCLPKTSNLT